MAIFGHGCTVLATFFNLGVWKQVRNGFSITLMMDFGLHSITVIEIGGVLIESFRYSEDTRPRSHNQNALGGAPIATSKTPKKDGTWKDFNTRLKTVSSDGRSRQSRPASFLDYKHSPQQSESRKKSTDTAAGRTGNLTQPKARNARLDRSITLRPPSPTVPQLPVPTPSTPYIDDARAAPRPLANPQRLLIVIDLNGTVLFRPTRTRPTYFITRPEVKRFFEYLFANHAVMVWSSARPENVELMCDKLFDSEQRKRLVAVWGRDTLGLSPAQYHAKVQVYKRLNQIWREPKLGQEQGVEWNQSNTLLIDDSLEKAKGEPYNAIQVPEFLGLVPKKRERENVLQQVVGFLEEARHWDNISSFVRERGFEADGRWNWPWPVDEDDLP